MKTVILQVFYALFSGIIEGAAIPNSFFYRFIIERRWLSYMFNMRILINVIRELSERLTS